MIHWERCSCNAAILTFSAKRAEAWRAGHIHDIQPEPEYGEAPTVVESVSQTERALPFGFTREMEGDLA